MCILVISGFLCDGIAGALGYRVIGFSTLFIPAGITASAAVAYAGWQFRSK